MFITSNINIFHITFVCVTMPYFRRTDAGFSSRRPGFNPALLHVRHSGLSGFFGFPQLTNTSPLLRIRLITASLRCAIKLNSQHVIISLVFKLGASSLTRHSAVTDSIHPMALQPISGLGLLLRGSLILHL
jgi:hypothetical protein